MIKNYLSDQVHFAESGAGKKSAVYIIAQKIRNQRGVLNRYKQSLVRAGDERLAILDKADFLLRRYESEILQFLEFEGTFSIQTILLIEARASKAYWPIFGLLCDVPQWYRRPRSEGDFLNSLLDVGYHFLTDFIAKIIAKKSLSPDIGIFHGKETNQAFACDMVELWRQPLVDLAVLNYIRRHHASKWDDFLPGILVNKIKNVIFNDHIRYKSECVLVANSIEREILDLRDHMVKKIAWKPARHLWGRSLWCK